MAGHIRLVRYTVLESTETFDSCMSADGPYCTVYSIHVVCLFKFIRVAAAIANPRKPARHPKECRVLRKNARRENAGEFDSIMAIPRRVTSRV